MASIQSFYIIIVWLVFILITACGEISVRLEDGTKEMVALLDSINQNVNPRFNQYANSVRLNYYKTVPPPFQTDQRISYQYSLAQEILKAGETETAIERYNKLLDSLEELDEDQFSGVTSLKMSTKENLALSYLRLGEQQNCILNHSSISCLFPIKGKGVHSLTEGSEKAIELYEEILSEKNSEDWISQWLLNIAYMTLGRHPQDVPDQWLIPSPDVNSQYDLGTFRDIAPAIGLAEQGLSGGSITEDFNQDGFMDVVASSWGLDDQIHYFENNGQGSFIKKTDKAGLTGITGGLNIRHADFNNDGFADVLVLRGAWLQEAGLHPNSLLQNNGDGTFSDVTKSAGLLSFHPTQTAEWGDFNNDGWLDLFIGNESTESNTHPSELYISQKDGTFKNVAEKAGVNTTGYIKGVAVGDYNNDGFQDVYISRLDGANTLFKNNGADEDGVPTFSDETLAAGVAEPNVSFPAWFWDYNNDGWLDIFVSAYYATPGDIAKEYLGEETEAEMPRLYQNNGDGTFTDMASEAGLDKVIYTMGSNFGDLDNDGFLDFYVGTGDPDFRSIMPNRMFRNNQGKEFQEVTSSGGFGHLQKGHGVSFADLDNDGDQDIFTVIGGAFEGDVYMNAMFENPGHGNHWVTLMLEGKQSNRMGIGTRIAIEVETPDGLQTIHKTVSTGSSFGSSTLEQEIGLGNATGIHQIKIYWPASGKEQVFEDVTMDQFYKVAEDSEELVEIERKEIHFHSDHTAMMNH